MKKSEYDPNNVGLSAPREGYTRIFEDHTLRWFKDFSPEQIEEMENDPFMKILNEEIKKEINKEIVDIIKGIK